MAISRLSDGKFVEANGAFVRWFGLDRDGILGHDSQELGLWPSLEARAKFWADLRSNSSVREVECQYRTRRGAVHSMLVSADIIEVNCEPHVLGLFLDVTERKRIETEWLRTLAREKELSKLRSNFVSMVSHEFRTPLGVIQSSAEILEDYLDQLERSERKDHFQSFRNNTRRMAGMMEEVLLLGSFDAGKEEFRPAALELPTFVEVLVDEILSATGRRCPIELSLSKMPAEIHSDERLLRHIFTKRTLVLSVLYFPFRQRPPHVRRRELYRLGRKARGHPRRSTCGNPYPWSPGQRGHQRLGGGHPAPGALSVSTRKASAWRGPACKRNKGRAGWPPNCS